MTENAETITGKIKDADAQEEIPVAFAASLVASVTDKTIKKDTCKKCPFVIYKVIKPY